MTRRERLERKLEKRLEWAGKRRAKAHVVAQESERYRGDHAFNTQPGHIPERARLIKREERAFGDLKMASHHEACADGIERALDRSIFSDDDNAIAALEARIAERERDAELSTKINKAWRKTKGTPEERTAALVASGVCSEKVAATVAKTMTLCPWLKNPLDTTNTRANIRRDRERIEEIRRRTARAEKAEAAGGVLIEGTDYVRVTFPEKPAREVLMALKSAGFSWGAGSWLGYRDRLPEEVLRLKDPAP